MQVYRARMFCEWTRSESKIAIIWELSVENGKCCFGSLFLYYAMIVKVWMIIQLIQTSIWKFLWGYSIQKMAINNERRIIDF